MFRGDGCFEVQYLALNCPSVIMDGSILKVLS